MPVKFRNYQGERGFSPDYHKVFDFLIRVNQNEVINEGFLWGRWEWMFSLERYFDTEHLSRIGIWEEDNEIVAIATYESSLGYAWFINDPRYLALKKDMLLHAAANMSKDGSIKVLIDDTDTFFQELALAKGFRPTQEREQNSVISLEEADCHYELPVGYRVVSMADEYDLKKYNQVLWRGFNHEGEPPETEEMLEGRRLEQSGPHVNLNLKIAVADPDGRFVSYCGIWHHEGTKYALVEPVATDPEYRRMGCGKAAVLEAVNRCRKLGALKAYVGSSQQFYYNIGFRPCSNQTWWEKKL